MIRTTIAALVVLALAPPLWALDPDKPKEAATPAEQVKALEHEYQEADAAFMKAYRAAKTNQERQKILQEQRPQPQQFAERFLKLAAAHPKDPAAVDALAWVVAHTSPLGEGKDGPRARALRLLQDEHVGSSNLGPVCATLGRSFDQASTDFLRTVLEKNPSREVQGAACMALGQGVAARIRMHERLEQRPQMAKAYENVLGKEAVEALVKLDPKKAAEEAEKYFERVVKEYADVKDPEGKSLSQAAAAELLGSREPIAVGKPAPEIQGEDIDGKPFKLSDYKGKVVLLDFWGHW
jgi:hypothetical protein